MEDRLTPGLYLEMTDRRSTRMRADRVPTVLAQPGVQRATWWRNVHRDRDDLPRVLPEFDHLGVYEVDETVRAAGDTAGHRRSPLPPHAAPGPGRASPASRPSGCRSC